MRTRPVVASSRVCLAAAAVVAACGSVTRGQEPYPAEANLRFEVWDGAQWGSQVNAHPGDRVEWRAVLSYVGTRTDLLALAEVCFQPIIPNADNEGPVRDELGPWRNGGQTGNYVPNSMLSEAEGQDGGPLASYGRVRFGYPVTAATMSNTLTSFRHSNGSDGAPAGEWLRVAGTFVSQWPVSGEDAPWTSDDGNRVARGVYTAQLSRYTPGSQTINQFYRPGVTDIVLMRQALIVGDAGADRTLEITTEERFLRRSTLSAGSMDNRRYLTWYSAESQTFGDAYRTSLASITSARAVVTVPGPGVLACVGVGMVVRRRRGREY